MPFALTEISTEPRQAQLTTKPNFPNDSKNINQYTPIELYKFNFNTIAPRFFAQSVPDNCLYISNQQQSDGSDIVMNGRTFQHCAVKIEGVSSELNKMPTNPVLTIDRTTFSQFSAIQSLTNSWTDLGNLEPFPLRGATVERMITLHEYKDSPRWCCEPLFKVHNIQVTAFGSGYTSESNVVYSGGGEVIAAESTIDLTSAPAVDENQTKQGLYASVPTLTVSGGGGTGAEIEVQEMEQTHGDTDIFFSGVKSRYFVNSILEANDKFLVLELTSSLGLNERTETNRRMPAGLCSLRYRNYINGQFEYTPVADGGCPYGQQTNGDSGYDPANNFFDKSDNPTTEASRDYCSKSIRACRLRWASGTATSHLPFMGQFRAGTPGTITDERD